MTPVWIDSQKNISHAEIVSEATGTPLSTTLKSQFEKCQNPNGYRVFFAALSSFSELLAAELFSATPKERSKLQERTFKTPRKNVQNFPRPRNRRLCAMSGAWVNRVKGCSKSFLSVSKNRTVCTGTRLTAAWRAVFCFRKFVRRLETCMFPASEASSTCGVGSGETRATETPDAQWHDVICARFSGWNI